MSACGPSTLPVEEAADTEAVTSDSSSSSSTTMEQLPPPSAASDESTTELPLMFLEPHDVGVAYECDIWTQDCPTGHKCTVWSNDGSSAWNATKCAPLVADPAQPGEPCTIEGSGTSGDDTCDLGSMCWDVDPMTLEGVCRAFCQGDESSPVCSDPDTQCGGPRNFPLCLPMCCPIEQDCAEDLGCYAISNSFYCAPDASGDLGAYGDPCEYINACKPGGVCLGAEAIPDCSGGVGCCTEFCLVGNAGSMACRELNPALDCIPWYEEDHAPPGLEFTGVCAFME